MNITGTLLAKIQELGEEQAATILGVKRPAIRGYLAGNKPSLDIAQKVVDLWFVESRPFRNVDPLPLWEGKDLCIMGPWYKSVHPKTVFSLLGFWDRTSMCYEGRDGDAMITRSRNHLARRFLRDTKCEWALWLDDDMIFPFGDAGRYNHMTGMELPQFFAALSTPHRLRSWGKSIVGGVYFDRHNMGTITAGYDNWIQQPLPHNSLFAARFTGTGCLLVHRKVFEDIAAKFPETYNPKAPGNECGFFTNIQAESGRMMGEDEAFGWRALQAGHQTFIDLGLICGHVGSQICGIPKR